MPKIKAEHFIRLWLEAYENGDGISWIGQRIGRPQSTVHSIASTLRRSGIELPSLRRKYIESVNIDDMNKMIKEQLKK